LTEAGKLRCANVRPTPEAFPDLPDVLDEGPPGAAADPEHHAPGRPEAVLAAEHCDLGDDHHDDAQAGAASQARGARQAHPDPASTSPSNSAHSALRRGLAALGRSRCRNRLRRCRCQWQQRSHFSISEVSLFKIRRFLIKDE